MTTIRKLGRREFLKLTGITGVGLLIGFNISSCESEPELLSTPTAKPSPFTAEPSTPTVEPSTPTAEPSTSTPLPEGPAELNAFISISPDDIVTLVNHRTEMGQGVKTALPMILAEEMCADWSTVRVVQAPANRNVFGSQNTGGSQSVVSNFDRLRQIGATVRSMLIEAAALHWGVEVSVCDAENGKVINRSNGKMLRFGDLAVAAMAVEPPRTSDIKLKDPADFTIIGKPIKTVDELELVTGSATYGLDVRVPGMLYATIARCPILGGSLASFNPAPAQAIEGVTQVLEIDCSAMLEEIGLGISSVRRPGPVIAVVAENTWAAIQGREALEITWNEPDSANFNSDDYWQGLTQTLQESLEQLIEGQPTAVTQIQAAYQCPFVAHVPMEPMNATIDLNPENNQAWIPTQFPDQAKNLMPQAKIHITRMGGAFGRRATLDFAVEALWISRAVSAPVQLVWTREDEFQFDMFRPGSQYLLHAGLDERGLPISLQKVAGGHRPGTQTPYLWDFIPQGYNIGTHSVRGHHLDDPPISTGPWRGPNASDEAFALECFLDEIARVGEWDTYEFRREIITRSGKMAVLDRVIEISQWGKQLPVGWGRGLACYSYFTSAEPTEVAHVAEISVENDGEIRVHRMYCAIDCGLAVNPLGIISQVESCIAMGLSVVLGKEITFRKNRIEQTSLRDYPILRMDQMPEVIVSILDSNRHPQGVGEPPIPSVAPAVSNAVFDATGIRVRRLPIRAEDLVI